MKRVFLIFDADIATVAQRTAEGFAGVLVGYFLPVLDVVLLLTVCFILDVLIGFWKAKKINGEKFQGKKIWDKTVPRMTIAFTLILLTFMLDTVYYMETVKLHRIVGYFFSGIVIASIAQNGYALTRWGIFLEIEKLIKRKTGINENDKMGE